MQQFEWNEEKNQELKNEREVSFEDVVVALQEKRILADIEHPNKKKYPNQRMFIVNINNYAYLIPYVEDEEKVFFKTIIPSRIATKKYLIGGEK